MADVTFAPSTQLPSGMTIVDAAGPGANGYNKQIADAVGITLAVGDKILRQSGAVQADTTALQGVQVAINQMKDWTADTWPPYNPNAFLSGLHTRFGALYDVGVTQDPNVINLAEYERAFQYADEPGVWQAMGQNGADDRPYLDHPTLIETGLPMPSSPTDWALWNPVTQPYTRMYKASDGTIFRAFPDRNPPITRVVSKTVIYAPHRIPTDKDIDSWRTTAREKAEDLTRVSQGRQAFLQDLVASLGKFLEFATNLLQRKGKTLMDMVGRIS